MIRVDIVQPSPADTPEGWETIASVTADGDTLTTAGDEHVIKLLLALTVPDVVTRTGTTTSQQDPEAWAATLPAVLRGPAAVAIIR